MCYPQDCSTPCVWVPKEPSLGAALVGAWSSSIRPVPSSLARTRPNGVMISVQAVLSRWICVVVAVNGGVSGHDSRLFALVILLKKAHARCGGTSVGNSILKGIICVTLILWGGNSVGLRLRRTVTARSIGKVLLKRYGSILHEENIGNTQADACYGYT